MPSRPNVLFLCDRTFGGFERDFQTNFRYRNTSLLKFHTMSVDENLIRRSVRGEVTVPVVADPHGQLLASGETGS